MNTRYAILFKSHTWDPFVERQLARLETVCRHGDIFIFKDQTKIFHPVTTRHQVLHASEAQCVALGLQQEPAGNLFWYSNDYPIYYFYEAHPEYDYYVNVEYDVGCKPSIDSLMAQIIKRKIDCVAQPISTPMTEWHWASSGQTIYGPEHKLHGALFCFSIFSRAAIRFLLERRRTQTIQFQSGNISKWPYAELFVATELMNAGFAVHALAEFGSVDHYDWWPPSTETQMASAPDNAFLHPVLDDSRYIASCLKFTTDLTSFLDPHSQLRRKLDLCHRDQVLPQLLGELRRRRDLAMLQQVKAGIASQDGERLKAHVNVALSKPATQSSVGPWSKHQTPHLDASGGNNGSITGAYGFHTGEDEQPWWMVDLETPHAISQIRIYNRLAVRHRARNLSIYTSLENMEWVLLTQRTDNTDFGGHDGQPYCVIPNEPTAARFVKIQLPTRSLLHLDEVEIYGEPV